MTQTMYFAGGCFWGVQAFFKTLPGVLKTEAGQANGTSHAAIGPYDGFAECVKIVFDPSVTSVPQLMAYFFEIIDPYSLNQQGNDVGEKYRTGVYSESSEHLALAREFIAKRADQNRIVVEVLPMRNYVRSAQDHQDRLERYPNGYCHIPRALLEKYKR